MLIAALLAIATPAPAEVEMWRLDCGSIKGADLSWFSDTHRYDGQKRDLVVSCYLIRHGDQYLLWDTGFGEKALGDHPTVTAQLARIGVKPEREIAVRVEADHPLVPAIALFHHLMHRQRIDIFVRENYGGAIRHIEKIAVPLQRHTGVAQVASL